MAAGAPRGGRKPADSGRGEGRDVGAGSPRRAGGLPPEPGEALRPLPRGCKTPGWAPGAAESTARSVPRWGTRRRRSFLGKGKDGKETNSGKNPPAFPRVPGTEMASRRLGFFCNRVPAPVRAPGARVGEGIWFLVTRPAASAGSSPLPGGVHVLWRS